jgi:hypothetical protein
MTALIKEERFIVRTGYEEHILRPQQLVLGDEKWPDEWQVNVAASHDRPAKAFYGETSVQVAAKAAKYLSADGSALSAAKD